MTQASTLKIKRMLADRIRKNGRKLWDWHLTHSQDAPPPFYCSIDLRDSGHKIVPVDSNLYPAGFNNICPEDLRAAPPIFRAQFDSAGAPSAEAPIKSILVIPESHTSNVNYLENIHYLTQIIRNAEFDVRVGWYGPMPEGVTDVLHLKSATGKDVEAFPIRIESGVISAREFVPDAVLLNNDFSSGYPKALDAVKQPIIPSHSLGWHSRKKSEHFKFYNELAAEFASILDIDPWHIQIDTEEVGPVNFNEDQGIEQAALAAERILERTRKGYEAHKVSQKPFVFIKNNSGTYGMGIMVAHDADEIRKMNRRTKNKMSVGKNRQNIESVVVQEGVPTATLVDRLAAEPVIYLMGCELIGGFLRTNTEKSNEENLNSAGMVFRKLCMSDLRKPDESSADDEADEAGSGGKDESLLELVYGSIARISALAAGKELKAHRRSN